MKRIIFVDDDSSVLDGLRRMLRGLRNEWDMHFVERGQAALEVLDSATSPFDVVVSDMRMPGMDGAELLKHVQERHPGTVRLVLSGHAELELSMRSASCAHQFLTKPCDSETIKAVVTRSLDLHQRLQDDRLRDLVGQLRTLPALPGTYTALNAAMADEEVTVQAVADIVERDSGIAAKLLQLVNSSFFGIPRAVGSMRDAVAYLGLTNIRTLVLQYGLIEQFDPATAAPSFCIEEHQQHALQVADLARRMYAHDRKASEQAFLAGILHDIGRLILATNMPDLFERVERLTAAGKFRVCELERRAIRFSHADLGAYLLGIWGMSDTIVEAALNHHEPGEVPARSDPDVVLAVHVADALLDELAAPERGPRLDLDLIRRLGLEDRVSGWREIALEIHAGGADEPGHAA